VPTLIENASKLDMEKLEGTVRLKSFAKLPKKVSGVYGSGTLTVKGGETLQYKVWDESLIERIENYVKEYGLGIYLDVQASGNVYNNSFSVVIEGLRFADQNQYNISDFYDVRHDSNDLVDRVNTILAKRVSAKGRRLVNSILSGHLANRFATEFAGSSMHDAEPVGLLHHTAKVLEITDLVMTQHRNFLQSTEDNVDLIYIGVLLHDIGKTLELKDGTYTNISMATHRFLGAELLFGYREEIIREYSETWYYNLISIITQHHGQYEERPRTVFSYIVHLVDNFDTRLTIIEESIERMETGQVIRMDDFNLKVEK
jgi:3'-5' exoribonuclease